MNRVLVVDDEAAMRAALEANFQRHGWQVAAAAGTTEALARFRCAPCPLVITDMRMPDGDGLGVMEGVRRLAPEAAVIFLTAFANVPEAVQAMREGACDYMVKPASFEQLLEAARRVLGSRFEASDTAAAIPLLVGSSPALRVALDRARNATRSDADVLIEAESGTGKELLARFIHRAGSRRNGPFVAVNCAALPESLLESELFGHVKGAFTGAAAAKPGKFELASGGTLLLDEIGELPLNLQPKLLRVLQEREVEPLGDQRSTPVDLRVIATTNRSLRALVREEKFRADLYYRLDVVPLSLPPLRERREDIPELVEHFLRRYTKSSAGVRPEFASAAMAWLREYDWPGNVRQLENLVRRALAMATGPVLSLDLIARHDSPVPQSPRLPAQPGMSMREMERHLLEITLEATSGNRTRAAEMLGVSLRTIRNKIREFGLPPREAA